MKHFLWKAPTLLHRTLKLLQMKNFVFGLCRISLLVSNTSFHHKNTLSFSKAKELLKVFYKLFFKSQIFSSLIRVFALKKRSHLRPSTCFWESERILCMFKSLFNPRFYQNITKSSLILVNSVFLRFCVCLLGKHIFSAAIPRKIHALKL